MNKKEFKIFEEIVGEPVFEVIFLDDKIKVFTESGNIIYVSANKYFAKLNKLKIAR